MENDSFISGMIVGAFLVMVLWLFGFCFFHKALSHVYEKNRDLVKLLMAITKQNKGRLFISCAAFRATDPTLEHPVVLKDSGTGDRWVELRRKSNARNEA